ncbi:MAG: enoyl-CoA hydratase/isomerase family protein [Dehalococcoidia bacterium]|nr:enoyl-CoA hydratase/isomerase family protein [Dehalococcoidia bacterium]
MEEETFVVEKSGPIATVTINRPEKLNAFTLSYLFDFKELIDNLRVDLETRLVIFTGAGRAFCAGIDVSEEGRDGWYKRPQQANERLYQQNGQDIVRSLENLHQVTIAAVNGPCIGLGLCIVTNCDFRIASEEAYFSIPETSLGIPYSNSCLYSLLALVGPSNAKRMIMTCEKVGAQEALTIGLANKVVPHEELMDASLNMARNIAAKGPTAIRLVKRMVNAATTAKMYDLCGVEAELVAAFYAGNNDFEEGLRAFREKRQPRFSTES